MSIRALWLVLAALVLIQYGPAKAQDSSITFYVQSLHPNIVDLEFYSQDYDVSWPGDGEVYSLSDDEVIEFPLSCQSGEQICYGAWVRGSQSSEWGVGKENTGGCESCCYVCDGGETPVIVIE